MLSYNKYVFLGAFVLLLIYSLIIGKSLEKEKSIYTKIFGYFLLGFFNFNIGRIPLPVGFIISLFYYKPKVNKRIKRIATIVGLATTIISAFYPTLRGSL